MRYQLTAVTVLYIFHQITDFSGKSFIIAFVRGGAGVVERDRLLSGYWDKTQSGVRIPPSPPEKRLQQKPVHRKLLQAFLFCFVYKKFKSDIPHRKSIILRLNIGMRCIN